MYCAKSKVVELTTYVCPRSCLNVIQGHAIGLAFSSKNASVCYTIKMIFFVLDTKTYLRMQVCMQVTVMSICVQFACVHLRFYTWLYYGRYEVSKGKTPSLSRRSNQRAKQYQLLPTQCFHMHNVALNTQTKAQVESKTKGPTLQSPRVHLGCNFAEEWKHSGRAKERVSQYASRIQLNFVFFQTLHQHLQLRSIQLRGSWKNMCEQLFCLTPGHENVRTTIRSQQKQLWRSMGYLRSPGGYPIYSKLVDLWNNMALKESSSIKDLHVTPTHGIKPYLQKEPVLIWTKAVAVTQLQT